MNAGIEIYAGMAFAVIRSMLPDSLRRRVAACGHLDRGAESVPVNIAHAGSSRAPKDRMSYLGHANGSALEIDGLLGEDHRRYKRLTPMNSNIEETTEPALDWNKLARAVAGSTGIIPVAVQHADTQEVILVAYTNEQAFRKAVAEKTLVLWSTSRNELWVKGKTSGEMFDLVEVRINCEQNSLLYKVRPRRGGICHTKNKAGAPRNCYYRKLNTNTGLLENTDP